MRKILWVVLLAGCARDLAGQDPPAHTIYYPISLAAYDPPGSADPDDQRYLYVLSSNFDLRYNAGWVTVIDFDALLSKKDKRESMLPQVGELAELKVPSLGGALAIDTVGGCGVIPHRGEPVVTLLTMKSDHTLSCGTPPSGGDNDLSSSERRTHCDRGHLVRLDQVDDTQYDKTPIAEQLADPFAAVLVDRPPKPDDAESGGLHAVIGHLSQPVLRSQLSVFAMDDALTAPKRPLPAQSLLLGMTGVGYLAVYPDPSVSFVVAASQYFGAGSDGSTLYSVDLARDEAQGIDLTGTLAGFEIMGMVFSPDAQLAFVANNRAPGASAGTDAVAVLDARLRLTDVEEEDGTLTPDVWRPRFQVVGAFSIQGRPTEIAYIERAGQPDLLAVVSFDDHAVFLFAPQDMELRAAGVPLSGALTPVARLDHVGEGPYAVRHVERGGAHYLVVAAFFSHELLVYDVSGDPTSFKLKARLKSEHPK